MAAYESYLDSRALSAVEFSCTGAPPPCEVGTPPAMLKAFDCTPTTPEPPGLIQAWDCTPTTGDPDGFKPKGKPGLITAWDCTPTSGDPDCMKTSPDTPIPPVPDEMAPAR